MDSTISLSALWRIFKQSFWKILIVTLVAVLITAAVTVCFIPKKYASSTEFYIVNVNQSIDYTNATTLNADEYLAQNYVAIIGGDEVLKAVSETLAEQDIDLSPKQIRAKLSSSSGSTNSTFTITVTDNDPARAYAIARALTDKAPAIVTQISKPGEITVDVPISNTLDAIADKLENSYPEAAAAMKETAESLKSQNIKTTVVGEYNRLDCITPLREPVQNDAPVSPNLMVNCLLVGALAAIAMYVLFFLLDMFNTTMYTEEDIKAISELPILGSIPSWKDDNAHTYPYYSSYSSYHNSYNDNKKA